LSSAFPISKPLRADARRNREKVLQAAREAFAAEGPDVQMEELAHRAGVGVGTVYRHFPTKDALIEALWADKRDRVLVLAQEALQNPDPWEGLVVMVDRGVLMQAEDLCWCAAFAGPPRGLTPGADPDMVRTTNALLERAQRVGRLRADVSFDDIGHLFCATAAVIATRGPQAGQRLARTILSGMERPPAGSA
jgi:AcrR family transcriptional regulator